MQIFSRQDELIIGQIVVALKRNIGTSTPVVVVLCKRFSGEAIRYFALNSM